MKRKSKKKTTRITDANKSAGIFVSDTSGPDEYACFFEATAGGDETPAGGYLYVSDQKNDQIIHHLLIYTNVNLPVREEGVQVLWSSDGTKCGVAIWGEMRGIVDLASGEEIAIPIENEETPGIADPKWLEGFDDYLVKHEFLTARHRYWREIVKKYEPDIQLSDEQQISPPTTNFIHCEKGPSNLFCVFEDDGTTGYLYIFEREQRAILQHVHLYDDPNALGVKSKDVDVVWSDDCKKCGVIIWNKMRGIIDIAKKREGRIWLESRDTPGITDRQWLKGFEYLHS